MSQPKMRSFLVSVFLVLATLCTFLARAHPAKSSQTKPGHETSTAAASSGSSGSESLPPDTFRKLAQALYQADRGTLDLDGQEDRTGHFRRQSKRLSRKFLYNGNVTCNDGSAAGFYVRRNYQSKRWVVFLEGGWICHDEESCSIRAQLEPHRTSSNLWPSSRSVGGILSPDPAENAHFHDANHVFVPYCSSDSWAGTKKMKDEDLITKNSRYNNGRSIKSMAFQGSDIIREVIRELVEFESLLFSEELYLAGSSAGATGVLINVDPVARMVANSQLKVKGIVDSGWFIDNDPFNGGTGSSAGVIRDLRKGVALWNARIPDNCARAYPGQDWKCFFGYRIFKHIESPLFIFQWQFDSFQLYADNVKVSTLSRQQWDYIHRVGRSLRSTFNNVTAVFSPSCISHEVLTKPSWSTISVAGVTLPDAIDCWANSVHSKAGNRISDKEGVVLHRSASMLSDSPHSYKLASNLVRFLPTNGDLEEEEDDAGDDSKDRGRHRRLPHPAIGGRSRKEMDNSIGSQLEKRRHGRKRGDNRLSFENGSSKQNRRRHQRRLKERKRKCDTESNSCEDSQREADLIPSNADFVRSLDRRSSQKRHRKNKRGRKNKNKRNKNRKRNKNLTEEEKRKRRERKQKRKAEEEERRKLRKERKRKLREKRRRDRRRMKQLEQENEEAEQRKHHLNVRSVIDEDSSSSSSSSCQIHLVDTCSWPHCNPTCPSLANPETGQEIDFLTLLRSFGLDLNKLARALGVNVDTLAGMERRDLLHLLSTSHPPPPPQQEENFR